MEKKRLSWRKVLLAPIGRAVITILGVVAIVVTVGMLGAEEPEEPIVIFTGDNGYCG